MRALIWPNATLLAFAGAISISGSAIAASSDFVDTPVSDAKTATPAPAVAATGAVAQTSARNDADFVEQPVEAGGTAPQSAPEAFDPLGFLKNVQRNAAFFGDMWGLRPFLAKAGTTLTIQEQSEVLGNLTGGTSKGPVYEGLTTATLQTDTQRAFGLYGGTFNVSALDYHGGNLSAQNLQTLQTASGIEADPGIRLWELWYQQKFNDQLDIKVGQQSLDQEFMGSQNANYFVNTMFGWPMLPSADMPGGGPAYPLSDLGVRARYHINDEFTLLAGVFNGSPDRVNVGDSQKNDPYGISFPLGQGALAIAELQYSYPGPNTQVNAGEKDALSRTYKIGFWYDSTRFSDLQYDNTGMSLANPASNGIPANHQGDFAVYGVVDQMIYRSPDDPGRNINVFFRPMYTPLEDRNLIDFSMNAGLTMHEPLDGRGDDTAGIGMGYTHVSASASAYDKAYAQYNPGQFWPTRSGETFFEATYLYQATAWLQVQPDAQFVFNPGGGLADPNSPNKKIGDELVAGVRVTAQF
jgi:porin